MKRGQRLALNRFSYKQNTQQRKKLTSTSNASNRVAEKEDILRDTGIAGVVATYELLYKTPPEIDFVNSQIEPFLLANSFRYLCGCGVYLAHKGMNPCKNDQCQAELYNAAETLATKLVFPRPQELLNQMGNLVFFSADTIIGSLAVLLRHGVDLTQPLPAGSLDLTNLATLMLKVNDFKYPAIHAEKPGSDEFRLDMIRQFLIQAPLTGVQRSFVKRVVRFYEIYEHVFKNTSAEFAESIDTYLNQSVGVGFDDLLSLIIPLNSSWITAKNIGPIYFENTSENSKMWSKIQLFINAVGLSSDQFKDEMTKLYNSNGEKFFAISTSMAKFVKHPFLKINENTFLLLAPFLLLRSIELTIVSAFIQFRPKDTTKIQDLYSPLGKAFEDYCSRLIERHLNNSKKITFEINPINPNSKNELCDSILENESISIVFECKYRLPPLRALEALDLSLEEIKKWVHDTYLLKSDEAREKGKTRGGLRQLEECAQHLLCGIRGSIPSLIVPVVVISEELISFLELYNYLDGQLKKDDSTSNPNVAPFLLMSVGDLELLTSVNFGSSKWNITSLIVEKATNKDARHMQWDRFLDRLSLKLKLDKGREKKLEELYRLSLKHFEQTE